tara:strand:- start:1010 stop:1366 length:357 start_codon:yes stop_codon:yes gene_type:complete
MTIMMSDSLIGRLDTRDLTEKKNTAEENGFIADVFIDDDQFSLKVDKFKRESSLITVSFFSSEELSKKFLGKFVELGLTLKLKGKVLFKSKSINRKDSKVEIKLNSSEYYTELSIQSD